jgi:hypothetical protein
MCFESSKYAKRKTTKTDIECWKILKKGRGFCSPYKKFYYKKGVINSLVKVYKDCYNRIFQGYHSYRSEKIARTKLYIDIYKLCKFIIPAGTHYYANVEGEYVSERIILIDNIKN